MDWQLNLRISFIAGLGKCGRSTLSLNEPAKKAENTLLFKTRRRNAAKLLPHKARQPNINNFLGRKLLEAIFLAVLTIIIKDAKQYTEAVHVHHKACKITDISFFNPTKCWLSIYTFIFYTINMGRRKDEISFGSR